MAGRPSSKPGEVGRVSVLAPEPTPATLRERVDDLCVPSLKARRASRGVSECSGRDARLAKPFEVAVDKTLVRAVAEPDREVGAAGPQVFAPCFTSGRASGPDTALGRGERDAQQSA
jgi:hypothetical protein